MCPAGAIAMRQGVPEVVGLRNCIGCRHCYAACPAGAIVFEGAPKALPQSPRVPVPADALADLFARRYSCREYRRAAVPSCKLDLLRRVLDAAPTGCNSRGCLYAILTTPEEVDAFRDAIYGRLDAMPAEAVKANGTLRAISIMRRRGADPILRGAPALAVAAYRRDAPTGLVDSIIGLADFEVMAQALGLGTCWCGFIPMVRDAMWPGIASYFGFPDDYLLGYTMLFGEKEFDYARPTR